jgi:hypothetical protein
MSHRRKPQQPRKTDPHLPFLSVRDADLIRSLMRTSLARQGFEVADLGDHLRDELGREFGLWNVATMCRDAGHGVAIWQRVVNHHVDKLMTNIGGGDPFEHLTQDELMQRVVTKLWDPRALPLDLSEYPHREFVPDLIEALGLQLPRGVAVLTKDRVERFGGWETLHRQGLHNLISLPYEVIEVVQPPTGGSFFVSRGDSIYTASQALLMPHFAHAVEATHEARMGWLISMPTRHEFCWHLLTDDSDSRTMAGMAWYAQWAYHDATGQLSPHVYWGNGDGYQPVTGYAPSGDLRFHIGSELEAIILALDPPMLGAEPAAGGFGTLQAG